MDRIIVQDTFSLKEIEKLKAFKTTLFEDELELVRKFVSTSEELIKIAGGIDESKLKNALEHKELAFLKEMYDKCKKMNIRNN